MPDKPRKIAEYGMIGNGRSAALIHRNGALEWLCWPRFDSDACFAALLGDRRNGHWTITPDAPFHSRRKYRDETLVLETTFDCETGSAMLVDFMPLEGHGGSIIRLLSCNCGTVPIRHIFAPAFGNGRVQPQWSRGDGSLIARAGVGELRLSSSHRGDLAPDSRFEITAGDKIVFVVGEQRPDLQAWACEALKRCESYWRKWAAQCQYRGPWRDQVVRSLITLKALIYQPTGGMVAAPTASLPEWIGGSRNWDYRFCWLRDSTLTVLALLHAGYRDEARAWVRWLLEAIAPDRSTTQPVYGLRGNPDLPEYEADWLSGFAGSRPVRFGNAAYRQFQLDVYGEVLDTVHQWHALIGSEIESSWEKTCEMLRRLEHLWHKPDAGFWEQRSQPEYFTQSRALAWVAFDRALKSQERFGFEGPTEKWNALKAEIHAEVCTRGFSTRLNAFTRSYGSESLDASTLLLPIIGFLPSDDPRILGTIEAIERNLLWNGFIHRYDHNREDDGIREAEGAFLPCCFWYADCLALQGRRDEAAALFEKYREAGNDLGLFTEEYDVSSGTMLGNFPQALTHLSLINTAMNLTGSGPAHTRSNSS